MFIANKMDRFKLQSTLLELGLAEQAVFANDFQQLLSRHHENAAILFAHIRSSIMKEISVVPAAGVVGRAGGVPPVPISTVVVEERPMPDRVDVGTMTARSSIYRLSARNTPRTPRYDPLPLKHGWNPMFDAQYEKISHAQKVAQYKLAKILKDRPVAASMLTVVPKSFVDKTLKEADVIALAKARRNGEANGGGRC
jgi:hypothetical protein